MRFILPFVVLYFMIAGCDRDKAAGICLPQSLRTMSDSIAYQYNSDHQPTAVYYYYTSNPMYKRLDLVYSNGRLVKVTHTSLTVTSGTGVEHIYNIEYGDDGMPSRLTDVVPTSDFTNTTDFTHDSNKRLVKAVMKVAAPNFPELAVKGYIYDYNEEGNVSTVKYLILESSSNTLTEVVARENVTFDNHRVFYGGSKDLTTLYVYVYSFIPNVNNSLDSRVTYTSFITSFASPVELRFTPRYDGDGRIKNNTTIDIFAVPQYGDMIFLNATYACY